MKSSTTNLYAAALVMLLGGAVHAFPGANANCANCHTNEAGALNVTPADFLEIARGESGQITFDVGALGGFPGAQASIAVDGLDDPALKATPDLGEWIDQGEWLTHLLFFEPGVYTLDVSIAADAELGEYPIDVRLAGGGGWSTFRSYAVRVVPEPSTVALLGLGSCVVLIRLRLRRRQGP